MDHDVDGSGTTLDPHQELLVRTPSPAMGAPGWFIRVTDRRLLLACLFLLGALLFALVAAAPVWPALERGPVWCCAAAAALGGVVVGLLRSMPDRAAHVFLVAGSLVIGASVLAGAPGTAGDVFATFVLAVVAWAAVHLGTRAVAAHAALAVGVDALAMTVRSASMSSVVEMVIVAAVVGAGGVILTALTRLTSSRSTHDALTGLLNSEGLARVVGADRAPRGGGTVGMLLLIDVDHFSQLNEALGRADGDEILRRFAAAFSAGIEGHGSPARLGGDDFVAWLPLVPEADGDWEQAQAALDMLAGLIAEDTTGPFQVGGVAVTLDVTIGAAVVTDATVDLTSALERADSALHAARRAGRPALVWTPELETVSADAVKLQSELRSAIADGQLRLHYQPQVHPHSGEVLSVEALVRWQHPTRGLLPPGMFLPAAEQSSVIVALTEWVLDEAVSQAARWLAVGSPLPVSVNLSARLVADEGLARGIAERLLRAGMPAELLTVEVTESTITSQPHRAAACLAELRELGVRTSLDDFGTGQTSLSMLRTLPFDELKVDRCFVAGALADRSDEAIVAAVLDLGRRLGMSVVAEGVEDAETAAFLDGLGYDLLQGYHFSRPLPAQDVDAFRARTPGQVVIGR